MVHLGRRKQDFFDPPPLKKSRQKIIPVRVERAEDIGHRAAHILDRGWTCVDCPEHINQHNLPVDLRKMITENGRTTLRL